MHESDIPGPGRLALKGLVFGAFAGVLDYFASGDIMRNGFVFPPRSFDAGLLEAGGAIMTAVSLLYFVNAGIDVMKRISSSRSSRR